MAPPLDAPRAEPVTWETVGPEPAMGPSAVGSPGPAEGTGEQPEAGDSAGNRNLKAAEGRSGDRYLWRCLRHRNLLQH